jgi:phosphopantetheinyl transferase
VLVLIETFIYSLTAQDLQWLTPRARTLLSEDEYIRWQRFRVAEPANVFLASRFLVRHWLAQRLKSTPSAIEFAYGEHGKPQLRWPQSSYHFNLSHSRDCIVFAVADGIELGVDIEACISRSGLAGLAEMVMTPEENAFFLKLDEAAQQEFFTRTWVLKESYVKWLGKGVWHGLNELATSLSPPFFPNADKDVHALFLEAPADFCAALTYRCSERVNVKQSFLLDLRTLERIGAID